MPDVIMDKPRPLNRMVLNFLSENQGPSTLLPVGEHVEDSISVGFGVSGLLLITR